LPKVRDVGGTYGRWATDQLPGLAPASRDPTLRWLVPLAPNLADAAMKDERSLVTDHREAIASEAQRLNLTLPPSFVTLVSSEALQQSVPSPTACYFDLPERIAEVPFEPGSFVIRFLNDQQWCCVWSLLLRPDGTCAVVCSDQPIDRAERDQEEDEDAGEAESTSDSEVVLCADSFEEFLYRFWFENVLWFALIGQEPALTAEQAAYVAFYQASR